MLLFVDQGKGYYLPHVGILTAKYALIKPF